MRNLRLPAFLVAGLFAGISAVFAQTEVHTMGHAPLLGVTPSTPELRQKFAAHPELVREAAHEIGLSNDEYHAFLDKFNSEKPWWGTVPRHLDAMSWSANGHVYAIHDVVIPAGVNGWEVDLRKKHEIVKIYIPMICGNLSVVRVPIHQVAVRPPLPPRFIPPAPPAPVPLVAAEAPPPAQQIPPVAPPAVVHHPHLFWPILAAAVVAGVVIGSNHHHDTPSGSMPVGGPNLVPGNNGGGNINFGPPQHHCGCGN